jgi:hypothetical protein
MSERFKKNRLTGWVRSSDGYAVRVGIKTRIDYRDQLGHIVINSERMSDPWNEIVVYAGSIPDTPERPKTQVIDRVGRAFEFAGWQMTLEDA